MGLFDMFKNLKTHEEKLDIAYRCFKPDIVGTIFVNEKKQANEVILKLAKILNIDLDKKSELEYYEILQVYAYMVIKVLIAKTNEENTVKGLQINHAKYVKNETMARKTLDFFLENYSYNIKLKQCDKKENIEEEKVIVDNNLNIDELLEKGTQFFNSKDYDKAKEYLSEYANKIEEMKSNESEKWMSFNSSIAFVLYCKKNNLSESFKNVSHPISSVYIKLAYIDFELHLLDEAEMFLNKALEWDPYNFSIINEKGEIYKAKKDFKNYYFNTLNSADIIYKESELARYYRNLGFYLIENNEWELAKAVYVYSLNFDFSPVVSQELEYIAQKSGNKEMPENDRLIEILKENRIITYISNENIKIIEELFESLKFENQLETALGKEVKELVEQYSKHK